MKNLIAAIAVTAVLVLAVTLSPGCGSACRDLATRCGDCTDANYQAKCEAVVLESDESRCSVELAQFVDTFCLGGTGGATGGSGDGGWQKAQSAKRTAMHGFTIRPLVRTCLTSGPRLDGC